MSFLLSCFYYGRSVATSARQRTNTLINNCDVMCGRSVNGLDCINKQNVVIKGRDNTSQTKHLMESATL